MTLDLTLFSTREAWLLFCAQLISQIGDRLMALALVWVVANTQDAELAPWLLAAGALPHLLLSGIAPRILNRFGALKTVIATDLVRGIGLVTFVALNLDATQTDRLPISTLFALQVFVNTFAALFNPAILVLPTRVLADSQAQAKLTALLVSCASIASILGPILSVLCYAKFGLSGVIVINGLSYIVAGALEVPIREVAKPSTEMKPTDETAAKPVSITSLPSRNPLLAYLLASFLFLNLFLGPLLVFIPLYVRHLYHGAIETVGVLETALGVGTVLGSVMLSFVRSAANPLKGAMTFIPAVCIAFLAFSASGSLSTGVACLGIFGFALSIVNVRLISLFQRESSDDEISTVMSAVNLISEASIPVSMALVGLLLSLLGSESLRAIALSFAGMSLVVLASFFAIPLSLGFPKTVALRFKETLS